MTKWLCKIGLCFGDIEKPNIAREPYKYRRKISPAHLDYLREVSKEQDDRQSTIENKTSQLVGQSSVVFSLFTLFVPLFYDRFTGLDLWIKGLLVFFFLLAFAFYLLTILHATRTLKINKYSYSTRDPDTVITVKGGPGKFMAEEIEDLIFSIKTNAHINNQKGTNLIRAHRTFFIGNLIYALLVVVVCSQLLFVVPQATDSQNRIEQLEEIEQIEKDILLEPRKNIRVDTTTLSSDSL